MDIREVARKGAIASWLKQTKGKSKEVISNEMRRRKMIGLKKKIK